MRRASLLLVLTSLLSACGTGVVNHQFEIAIEDPAGRLEPPPVRLSVFDPRMGGSAEWAGKTAGTAEPHRPFSAPYSDVVTRGVLSSGPPTRVTAGVWIPSYQEAGYFSLVVEPRDGEESSVSLPFVPWRTPYPEGRAVAPLTARIAARAHEGAWILTAAIEIP